MNKTIVSAPGKIHLMGEHAVVHGAPALLTAINRRLVISIADADSLTIETSVDNTLIQEAIEVVCGRFKIAKPNIALSVRSAIPAGRHLGSSAAVSVATVGALLYHLKKIWNPDLINKLAYEVEKKQHGTPSGGDNSICTYGGFVWFRRELPDLKTIWQLPYKIHSSIAPLYLIDTGAPDEHTGEMVSIVHDWVAKNPAFSQEVFSDNEQATKDVAISLKAGNEKLLIDALIRGEKTLEQMGVVSESARSLIRSIESTGGAAKILGGGGKTGAVGYVLVYHADKKKLETVVRKQRLMLESILLGEEGIRLESGRLSV